VDASLPHGFHAQHSGRVTSVWADNSPRWARVTQCAEQRWELEGYTRRDNELGQSLSLVGTPAEVMVLAVAFCAPGTPLESQCWTVAHAIVRNTPI